MALPRTSGIHNEDSITRHGNLPLPLSVQRLSPHNNKRASPCFPRFPKKIQERLTPQIYLSLTAPSRDQTRSTSSSVALPQNGLAGLILLCFSR